MVGGKNIEGGKDIRGKNPLCITFLYSLKLSQIGENMTFVFKGLAYFTKLIAI